MCNNHGDIEVVKKYIAKYKDEFEIDIKCRYKKSN